MKNLIQFSVMMLMISMMVLTGCDEAVVQPELPEQSSNETQAETTIDCVDAANFLATYFAEANSTAATCKAWKEVYEDFVIPCDGFISNSIEQVYDDYLANVDCDNL